MLAPYAKLRAAIVPAPSENESANHAHAQPSPARLSWARLLKRVFDIDLEHCPECGGSLKIIAAIIDPSVIVRVLAHLGLPSLSATAHTGAPSRSHPSGLSLDPIHPVRHLRRGSRSAGTRASG